MGQVTIAASSRSSRPGVRDLFVFPALDIGPEISGAGFAMKPRSRGSVRLRPGAGDAARDRSWFPAPTSATSRWSTEAFERAARARREAGGAVVCGRRAAAGPRGRRGRARPRSGHAASSIRSERARSAPVVDERCRVLGFENLYVVDASAITRDPVGEHESDHGRDRRAAARLAARLWRMADRAHRSALHYTGRRRGRRADRARPVRAPDRLRARPAGARADGVLRGR